MTSVGPAVERMTVDRLAVGGEGVARDRDGRVVFVASVAPGDVVDVEIVEQRRRFARGRVRQLVSAGAGRAVPPCPEVERGCGGCGWQHLTIEAQRAAKVALVGDALSRIGRLDLTATEVTLGPLLAVTGFRTTLRCLVGPDGRTGFRRARSHDVVIPDQCLVAHPLLADLLADGRFGNAREVTLRVGPATGERQVVTDPPDAGPLHLPADVRRGAYHDVVAGQRWRISPGSFFQSRADGAALLVDRVAAALRGQGSTPPPIATLLDACSGVGLLSAAAPDAAVVAVEANASSVADARENLADRDARVLQGDLARWSPQPVDAVVADPARAGLGAGGVAAVAGTGAPLIVLVSCDAGSLGRDAAGLVERGYRLERCEVLDLFPHTPHVEVISRFTLR